MLTSATLKLDPTEKFLVMVELQVRDSAITVVFVLVNWLTVCADAMDGQKHRSMTPKITAMWTMKLSRAELLNATAANFLADSKNIAAKFKMLN